MKKIALILALVMSLSLLVACGNTNTPAASATAPEGTCEELINKVYENVTVELPLMTMPIDLADLETLTWLTTLESAEGLVEVAVNESMMGAQAYSLVLVRTESSEKAAAVAPAHAYSVFQNNALPDMHLYIAELKVPIPRWSVPQYFRLRSDF